MNLHFASGLALLLPIIAAVPAMAHPHVWVTAKAELVYAPDGKVAAVRHTWTFDEAYSAYVTQGLDANHDGRIMPDELQELAKVNAESLVEFDYFTVLKANGAKQAFGAPRDYGMTFEKGAATLSFQLPLKNPAAAARLVAVEIYDPTYFVAFTLSDGDEAVRLSGAPNGCRATITRPKPPDAQQSQKLSEAFFSALSAGANFGAQFSNRILVACP